MELLNARAPALHTGPSPCRLCELIILCSISLAWDGVRLFFFKKNDKHGSEYDEQERAAQHNIRIIHVELDFEN